MFFSSFTKHDYTSNNSGSKRGFQNNNKIPVWAEFREENQTVVFIPLYDVVEKSQGTIALQVFRILLLNYDDINISSNYHLLFH